MKIEIVNTPFLEGHKVSRAEVKVIGAEELQEGEIILFGQTLELVEKIHTIIPNLSLELRSLSEKIKEGELEKPKILKLNLPMNTIFLRVLPANYNNEKLSFYNWKRLRKPIVDEELICGACGSPVRKMTEQDLKRFEEEIANNDTRCGALQNCYDSEMDFFQDYDGCEG
jgi:hypothetical protein